MFIIYDVVSALCIQLMQRADEIGIIYTVYSAVRETL